MALALIDLIPLATVFSSHLPPPKKALVQISCFIFPFRGGGFFFTSSTQFSSNPRRLFLQPRPGPLPRLPVEESFRLVAHLVVIGVDPGALDRGEEVGEEEAAAKGDHGDVLKAEVGFVAEGVRGVGFARHYDI